MTTSVTERIFFPQDGASPLAAKKVISNGHAYAIIPAAHGNVETGMCVAAGGFLLVALFIAGIVLWVLGGLQSNTEMLMAGEVLTGIHIVIYGGLVLSQIACFCCWSLCEGCCHCCCEGPS